LAFSPRADEPPLHQMRIWGTDGTSYAYISLDFIQAAWTPEVQGLKIVVYCLQLSTALGRPTVPPPISWWWPKCRSDDTAMVLLCSGTTSKCPKNVGNKTSAKQSVS